MLTGAEIVLECLLEQNVDTIFGYPGGAVLNIYDALYKYKHKIRHIRTSHEQGAAHAADGFSRATGRVGVCLATSGPGATNLVTGVATAFMDSIPMVVITGNVGIPLLGKDSFQEVDITGITMPITKHNYIVKDINDLASTIRKAFHIAQEGRPGPVLIDIPKDITAMKAEYTRCEPFTIVKRDSFSSDDIDVALDLIKNSKKPLIYAGGGVISSGAEDELFQFAELLDAGVCLSLMGLGGFPCNSKRYTGIVGMHGTKTSNIAVCNCDLLIAVGARFSDRVVSNAEKFARNAKILHIDIDPAEINKNVKAHSAVIGDIGSILSVLNKSIAKADNSEWMSFIHQSKEKYPLRYADTGAIRAQHVIEAIHDITDGQAIICTEVGQNQIWAAQCYCFDTPRTFVSSGGLGTMGFGLGAAIGAQTGMPNRKVFNIAGDGSFRMNLNELITAATFKLPIVTVVLNNQALGMVRQWQSFFYDNRFSQTDVDYAIDYFKLAEAFGICAFEIKCEEDIVPVLRQAIECERPVIINCVIDMDDKVFPMIPPGAGIDEIIMEDEC